ncbi:MAG: phasin family protein [Pseudomonadota bacterium]
MFETIKDRTAPFVDTAADRTRNATVMLADAVARTHRPVDLAVKTSLKLNEITHKSLASLVKQQASMIEGTVDAASKRLHVAADADNLRDLVNDQLAMFPATRDRLAKDARNTVAVFTETREELTDLVRSVMEQARKETGEVEKTVRTAKRTVTRKARTAKKTAAKTRAKVAKKTKAATSRKKTTASKAK